MINLKYLHTFALLLFVQLVIGQTLTVLTDESRCTNSGSISCTYDTALLPITFSITGPSGPQSTTVNSFKHTFTALSSGVYFVSATDANNITKQDKVRVAGDYSLPTVSAQVGKETTCPGSNNGLIFCDASGGRKPFNYELYNGTNNTNPADLVSTTSGNMFANIPEGPYTIVAVDSCDNQVATNITMTTSYTPFPNSVFSQNVQRVGCDSVKITIPLAYAADYEYAIFVGGLPSPSQWIDAIQFNVPYSTNEWVWLWARSKECPDELVVFTYSYNDFQAAEAFTYGLNCSTYTIGLWSRNLLNPVYSYTDPHTGQLIQSNTPPIIQATTNFPYTITVTDDCGFTYSETFNLRGFAGYIVHSIQPDHCKLGEANVILRSINGEEGANPWTVNILNSPPEYTGQNTFQRSFSLDNNFTFSLSYRLNVSMPIGSYEVEFIDDCGRKDTLIFSITDLLTAELQDVEEVQDCGSNKNINFSAVSDAAVSSNDFYLFEIGSNNLISNSATLTFGVTTHHGVFSNIVPGAYYIEWRVCNNPAQFLRDTISVSPPAPLDIVVHAVQCGSNLEIDVVGSSGTPTYEYRLLEGPTSGINSGNMFPTTWSSFASFSRYIPGAGDPNYKVQVRDVCNSITTYEITGYQSNVPAILLADLKCNPTLELTFEVQPMLAAASYTWSFPDASVDYGARTTFFPVSSSGTVTLKTTIGNCPEVTTTYNWNQPCLTVPVEFVEFSVRSNENNAALRWQTASETGMEFYSVKRKNNEDIWQKIGRVEASMGTENTYKFIDQNLQEGTYLYQVVGVEFNGTTLSSPSKAIKIDYANSTDFNISPNPANDFVYLDLEERNQAYRIEIIDLNGQVYYDELAREEAKIDTNSLPASVYIVFVINTKNGISSSKKLVVSK